MAGTCTLILVLRRQVNSVCVVTELYDVWPPFYVGKFLINF